MKKHESNDKVLYKKQCKYVGSIAVPQRSVDDRQQFINEKFDEMKDVVKGISVVFMVTEEGVKILKEDASGVKMAHSVTRIMLSTCQPERKLFAYVAKAANTNNINVVQAHMFKTKRSSHAKEINSSLSKAFKIAQAKATMKRQVEEKSSFDVDILGNRKTKIKGKRWAKQEIAFGHNYALHSKNVQDRMSQPVEEKLKLDKISSIPIQNGSDNQSQFPYTNHNKTPSQNQNKKQLHEQSTENITTKLDSSSNVTFKGLPTDIYEQPIDGTPRTDGYQEVISDPDADIYEQPIDGTPRAGANQEVINSVQEDDAYEQPIDGTPHADAYQEVINSNPEADASKQPIDCSPPAIYYEQPLGSSPDVDAYEQPICGETQFNADSNAILASAGDPFGNINDINTPAKISSAQRPYDRHEDILSLTTDSDSSAMEGNNRPHVNFVSPAQRFSTIEMSPTERFSTSDSQFEGYVNVVDKKNEPLPALPLVDESKDSQLFEMTEDDILKDAEWFQAGFSREIAESILADRSIGSFFIRNSQTQTGSYVITVKIPKSCKPSGIGNFLIEVKDGEYSLKGFSSKFKSLTDIVAHYASCKEDLPVQLHLGFDNKLCMRNKHIDEQDNTADEENDDDDDDDDDEYACEDSDYQYFTSADDMLNELASL